MSAYIFTAPMAFWSAAAVASAVRQARDAARRIGKGVDVGAERARLSTAIRAIDVAVTSYDPSPRLLEGPDARSVVDALPRVGAVRLPFIVPEVDEGSPGYFIAPVPFAQKSLAEAPQSEPAPAQHYRDVLQRDPVEDGESKRRLARDIDAARQSGRPVPIGTARHPEITLALRAALHAEPGREPFTLRLIYGADGSESGPIELGVVPMRPRPSTEVEFDLGLESCRHFDTDAVVDLYLLRNTEFERQEAVNFREQEELAFRRASAFLKSHITKRGLHLRLFHAGLEPAVIGTYRAIIDSLRNAEPLVVTPVFHVRRGEEEPWW